MKNRRATIPMTLQNNTNPNYTSLLRVVEPPKPLTNITRFGMFQNLQNVKPCGSCGNK
jgi:hypothetical protein